MTCRMVYMYTMVYICMAYVTGVDRGGEGGDRPHRKKMFGAFTK